MSSYYASINYISTAGSTFTDTAADDVALSTTSTTQSILLGNGQNRAASVKIANNKLTVANTFKIAKDAYGILPAGVILCFTGNSVPTGYLLCDGSNVSTTTYSNLYATIGYIYGGSGSSFTLPNLKSYFSLNTADYKTLVQSAIYPFGKSGGSSTVSLASVPSHTHSTASFDTTSYQYGTHTHPYAAFTSQQAGEHNHNIDSATQTASSHSHAIQGTTSTNAHTHTLQITGSQHTHSYQGPQTGNINNEISTGGQTGTAATLQQLNVTGSASDLCQGVSTDQTSSSHTHAFSGTTQTPSGQDTHTHAIQITSGAAQEQQTQATVHQHGIQTTTAAQDTITSHTHTFNATATGSTGSSGAHQNMPPYLTLYYIIKY